MAEIDVLQKTALVNLPIYLVLDCSGGMFGDPLEALKEWLRTLHGNLLFHPVAFESIQLAVITFSDFPRLAVPLTDLSSFVPPELEAAGLSNLGAALDLLYDCLKENPSPERDSVSPVVFLVTDGCATDDVQSAAERLRTLSLRYRLIALPCGSHADTDALRLVTPHLHSVRDVSGNFFETYLFHDGEPIAGDSPAAALSPSSRPHELRIAMTLPPGGVALSFD